MEYKINAEGKILGRLASEIAVLLRGKNSPSFDPARLSGNKVLVYNTNKLRVTGKKMTQKLYRRHSGHIGSLKEIKLRDLIHKDSRLVLKKAVMGMLPKNRSRAKIIKNLILHRVEQ